MTSSKCKCHVSGKKRPWGPALDRIVFLGDFHLVLLACFGAYEDHANCPLRPSFPTGSDAASQRYDDLIRTTLALPILKSKCSLA